MSKRTTIVLAAIALGMAAFIVFFESGMLSTGELEARRGRVLQRFVRPRVTEVEVVRGEGASAQRIVLHREREENLDAFEVGHWRITEPVQADADQDAVDQLLSSLEWLEARRSLTGIDDEDRQRFGLASPRASVRFTVAGTQVTVALGGEDPLGDGVYVGVSDRPDRAFVVGRDFVEALEHDVSHFRRKELFDGVRSADVSSVSLRNQETSARIERSGEGWMLREPFEALARSSALDELFTMLRQVSATRFLAEGTDELARYGLDQPSRELVVRREREGRTIEDRSPLRLRIGGPCPEHEGELTAIAGEDGPIVCVAADAVARLDGPVERLRESRLLAMRDDAVERIEITGAAELRLRRDGSEWELVRGESEQAADAEAIADWTRALRVQEAVAYEPATDEALRARGLASPRVTLAFVASDDDRSERILVGASDGEGVWVRRGSDPQITRFPAAAAELLAPSAIRFRNRRLVRDADQNARRMHVVRGSSEETLEKRGTEWRVTAPVDVPADRVIVRDVARAVAGLTAVRFVAERPAPEHGLDRPRVVLTATFEGPQPGSDDDDHDHAHGDDEDGPPREVVLRIGAATEGGAFAQLGDDPAVFVIANDVVEDLEGPLASRDLLATETSQLESLAIVRGGERIVLRREGDGWSAGQGPADEARTTLILDRLASMRALGTTSYGEGGPDAFPRSPTLVLEVQRRSGTPEQYALEVGAAGAGGADGWYHARRTDLAIGYRLGASVVRAFLDYQP